MGVTSFVNKNNAIIGLIVAILGIVIPLVSSNSNLPQIQVKSLIIQEVLRSAPFDNDQVIGKKIKFLIGEKEYESLMLSTYVIKNSGNTAIIANDFDTPIKLKTLHNIKVINVKVVSSVPKDLNVKWEKISDTEYLIKPLLLNAGDGFKIVITLSKEHDNKFDKYIDKGLIDWSVRIKNVPDISITNIYENELLETFVLNQPESLKDLLKGGGITFELSFKSLPIIFILTILFSILGLLILNKTGDIDVIRPKILLLFILTIGLSLSTSEIISYYIFGSKIASPSDKYINFPLLSLHALFIGFFIIKSFFKRK